MSDQSVDDNKPSWRLRLGDWYQDKVAEFSESSGPSSRLTKAFTGIVGVALLYSIVGSFYFGQEPDLFSVQPQTNEQNQTVVGYTTTATLIKMADVLLNKPGGFLSNDQMPPGVFMDNIPSWEYGVLIQLRDITRALRKDISRSQSQSREDTNLAKAEPAFNIEHTSWLMPTSESKYREGASELNNYLQRLSDTSTPGAQFYARADNLTTWLADVETRLGSLSQRLSASVGKTRVNIDLAGDSAATQSTNSAAQQYHQTSWWELDDVFYEARGTAWALVHILKAVQIDFAAVLERKNALISLQQIIQELESTQETLISPMVLNGSGFGPLANHSLVMASYIARANAAIIDLRSLLTQG